jgi:hypothetical protein
MEVAYESVASARGKLHEMQATSSEEWGRPMQAMTRNRSAEVNFLLAVTGNRPTAIDILLAAIERRLVAAGVSHERLSEAGISLGAPGFDAGNLSKLFNRKIVQPREGWAEFLNDVAAVLDCDPFEIWHEAASEWATVPPETPTQRVRARARMRQARLAAPEGP